jgi:hypothetical protein
MPGAAQCASAIAHGLAVDRGGEVRRARSVSLEEIDRRRGLCGQSLNGGCVAESVAGGRPELAFGEEVGDDGVNDRGRASVRSPKELARKRAHRLDREPEDRPSTREEVGDRAPPGGRGRNSIEYVARARIDPAPERVEGALVVVGVE